VDKQITQSIKGKEEESKIEVHQDQIDSSTVRVSAKKTATNKKKSTR